MAGYEGRDGTAVKSLRAGGTYFISRTAEVNLKSATEADRVKLSHEVVSHQIAGARLEITTATVSALASIPSPTVAERALRLLRFLVRESPRIGAVLEFTPDWQQPERGTMILIAWPVPNFASAPLLAWSDSLEWEEVSFLLRMLESDGLITLSERHVQPDVMVTAKGYSRLEESSELIQSDQAFIAMWFDPSLDAAYAEGLEPGIRDAGFRPLRIDNKEHVNKIDDEIVAEIRRSRFVVADFTSAPDQPRGGVYFEAGFAMGRGIPVIWTCREDLISSVHFDTRQFNHIVWNDPAQLRDRLLKRILAVIGEGPLNTPTAQ